MHIKVWKTTVWEKGSFRLASRNIYIYFPLYLQPVVDEPGCVSIAKGDPIENTSIRRCDGDWGT